MDSGSSASLHSSSGGAAAADEDFDSRNESISSFLNHSSAHFNPNQNPVLQALNTNFFDSSSPSFFQSSNSTNLNNVYDPVWSRNIPPDPMFTGFGAIRNDDVFNSQQSMHSNNHSSPPVSSNANMSRGSDRHQVGVATKNPRKRTRASRRAPTTVLTTDTTNFRQMVQEFTGIPSAPFSAVASSTYSRRLDHFGRGGGGGIGSLFPVRPSPQKIQLQQPSITSVDASSSNYQLPPSNIEDLQTQSQTLLNSQNPLFSLQSLLQTKLSQQVNATILGTSKLDNQQTDFLSGFTSSSTRWRGPNDNLVNLDGVHGNTPKLDGYKVNTLDFDHHTDKDLENVVSSRNGGDQGQG